MHLCGGKHQRPRPLTRDTLLNAAQQRAAWPAVSTAAIDENLTALCVHCCALCVPWRNWGGF